MKTEWTNSQASRLDTFSRSFCLIRKIIFSPVICSQGSWDWFIILVASTDDKYEFLLDLTSWPLTSTQQIIVSKRRSNVRPNMKTDVFNRFDTTRKTMVNANKVFITLYLLHSFLHPSFIRSLLQKQSVMLRQGSRGRIMSKCQCSTERRERKSF